MFQTSTLPDSKSSCQSMTTTNGEIQEFTGVRLPFQPYAGGHAVFMYSTAADGNVTLQLKEPDDLDRTSLAAMLAKLQDDATFSISYQDTDILSDGGIDVLLETGTTNSGETNAVPNNFDLFDSSSGPDLTLSPQTFTNSTEVFMNDNSNSLGVPSDDTVSTTTEEKQVSSTENTETVKLSIKKIRPKASSPNRQGPQQCQVCSKVFGNASALAKHKLTHSDERKYVCTMCGKAFKRQDHLNGHMLTHRNKKPYECKAEGCGKSYCDARSLRRHTENHHNSTTMHNPGGTMSPVHPTTSGETSSPAESSCIQYAPPPTSSAQGKSQLQQLLATEPAKIDTSSNNDDVTNQHISLIHHIMEETQRQSIVTNKPIIKNSVKTTTKMGMKVQKLWSNTTQNSLLGKYNTTNLQISTTGTSQDPHNKTTESKPVECNLCHRKFKNIPALNGHMRLHGGYFKKDSESKKNEKKDTTGIPLQTASVSVRALIEEKIINKRITTNPQVAATVEEKPAITASDNTFYPLTIHSSTAPTELDTKLSSFLIPAPPQLVIEKGRRHSDTEAFSKAAAKIQYRADILADIILNKDKVPIKRTASDPGHQSNTTKFQSVSTYNLLEKEYLSNNNNNEDMLTYITDRIKLNEKDHSKTKLDTNAINGVKEPADLQRKTINSSMSSSQSSPSVNFQNTFDSSLSDSLSEFSTFHANLSHDSPIQISHSPQSPINTHSPLQSPLVSHDSPGFAYPTPPASHEGQSPCFGQNAFLPVVSPNQDLTQIDKEIDNTRQISSPLSAAFFTSTMSSSAEVEEALEEVLPDEDAISNTNQAFYPLPDSSVAQSPSSKGLTPIPSPISNSITSSVSSPQTTPTVNSSTVKATYPTSPHVTFQSQMMPNSDDPLLSSSPKDFTVKKKFEFNSIPLKIMNTNGLMEINGSNIAGILVDTKGEIKFIQTGNGPIQQQHLFVNPICHISERDEVGDRKIGALMKSVQRAITATSNSHIMQSITTTKNTRKRPSSELDQRHRSKLRSRKQNLHEYSHYTPQPMLNPERSGTGLFRNLEHTSRTDSHSNIILDTPHINIGSSFQCTISPHTDKNIPDSTYEDLLWDPGIYGCTDFEVDMYLDFACCAAVPGGGRNKEYAMHILQLCKGDIHDAILRLMQPCPKLPCNHPLLTYHYSDSDKWTARETEVFHSSLLKFDKDFRRIAQDVGTKSTKQCVNFYYVWKKICTSEYHRLKYQRAKSNKCGDVKEHVTIERNLSKCCSDEDISRN